MSKTRNRHFKYSVLQLIEHVKIRPCLWDKSIEDYKDRVERRNAWVEIFKILEENYEQMTPEYRRMTEEQIMYKWTNIRDTFMKSLKMKTGKPKKKYMLYNHLKFLKKIILPEENNPDDNLTSEDPVTFISKDADPDTSYRTRKRSIGSDEVSHTPKKSRKHDFEDLNESKPRRKKQSPRIIFESDSVEELDDNDVDEMNDPRLMNEDEAFFASLLPTVVQYSEDEKLEFRIEVLSVMKKIKERTKCSSDEIL